MISDRRLEQGDVRGRILLLEDTVALTDENRRALRRYVERGGRVLLTGRAIGAAQWTGSVASVGWGLTRQACGQGEVFGLPQPVFKSGSERLQGNAKEIFEYLVPPKDRWLTTDAPETVEVLLREKDGLKILHMLNIAPGQRQRDLQAPGFLNLLVKELPPAPACKVSLRLSQPPVSVRLQPQDQAVTNWTWRAGRLELSLPSFQTHQIVVISPSSATP